MPKTLVAGATGYLGRHIVAELHHRGHSIRAIARDRDRAESPGPWSSPALSGLVDEWAIGDVTDEQFTHDVAHGIDHVISALGVTRQRADPWTIDNLANLAVLNSALRHKVDSFTYVNVLDGDLCPAGLTRAKTAFAQTLAASPVSEKIVNPSGYFSDMMDILHLARRGVVPLLRPQGRISPIHGADLASFCVDRLEGQDSGSWDIGGPDALTWSELAHMAFAALGKRPRVIAVPKQLLGPALRATALFSPRIADTARFATWGLLHDSVAPSTGTHHLADFYAEASKQLE